MATFFCKKGSGRQIRRVVAPTSLAASATIKLSQLCGGTSATQWQRKQTLGKVQRESCCEAYGRTFQRPALLNRARDRVWPQENHMFVG